MILLKKFQNFALYLFAFSLSFEFWNAFDLKNLSIGAMSGYLYAFSIIIYPKFRFNARVIRKYISPLLIFFFILTISSFANFTIRNEMSWFNMSIFQCIVIFIFISLHLIDRGPKVANKVVLYYLSGSLLLSFLFAIGYGIEYSMDIRLIVFGYSSNGLGFIMAVSVLIILSIVFENKFYYTKIRYLLLLFLPIILKAISETGSRGAFITLAVGLIIFTILIEMRRAYKSLIFIIASITGYFMVQYMLQTEVLKTRLQLTLETGDTSNRIDNWASVISIFKQSPVFGVGETGYFNNATSLLAVFQGPHNVFIEVLIYTGIIGSAFFIFLLYRLFRSSLVPLKKLNYFLPVSMFFMIMTLFMYGQGLFVKIVWLIFGIIVSFGQFHYPETKIKKDIIRNPKVTSN